MNVKAFLFTIAGAIVALFYAFESFLSFWANGFTATLLVKILISGVGAYFFLRNVKHIKKSNPDKSANAA